eukprot:Sspe_Gene.68564::Locus_40425_Transcript_1_1_Confidence_1.000_Length_1357::g.68564::m.68564
MSVDERYDVEQAAREGPQSVQLDQDHLRKCCATVLAKVAEEAAVQAGSYREGMHFIHLQWTCVCPNLLREERATRSKFIKMVHPPYQGLRSCLLVGGQVHRYQRKNKKKHAVDEVFSVKQFREKRIEDTKEKIDKLLEEYKLIICDNRCMHEIPRPLRAKVAMKIDCTDVRRLQGKLSWAVQCTSIRPGKGVVSMRIANTRFTVDQLMDNVRFTLRYLEVHHPDIFKNIREASLVGKGCIPIPFFTRSGDSISECRKEVEAQRVGFVEDDYEEGEEEQEEALLEEEEPVVEETPQPQKRPREDDGEGIDIFAIAAEKKKKKGTRRGSILSMLS